MKAAWIALAVLVAYGSLADSNPPVPTPVEKSSPVQKATQNKGRSANQDQRGTEDRPLWVRIVGVPVVEMQGGPEAQQKPTETTNKENNSPTLYGGFAADAWTALFTLGLFLVGGATAIVFLCQTRVIGRQVNEMVRATNANVGIAVAQLLPSHLNFGDMGVADLRAKIQSPKIEARVRNYGNTFAVPKFQSLKIICANTLPDEPEYAPVLPIPFAGMVLETGQEWPFVESSDRQFFSTEEIDAIESGAKFLWVYGFIGYQDFLGTYHERRFCQRLYIVSGGGHTFGEDRRTPEAYTKSH
jgi:hypothetical protein